KVNKINPTNNRGKTQYHHSLNKTKLNIAITNTGIPSTNEKVPIFLDISGFFTRDKKSEKTERLNILIIINSLKSKI
ncbi:MAG: hypothetical protein ACFFGP_12345, partial [Promethearchaeota archaeon]